MRLCCSALLLLIRDLPEDATWDDPSENMEVFEHVEGDTFRRVCDDGGYGETLEFIRNDGGRITQGRTFNYVFRRQ